MGTAQWGLRKKTIFLLLSVGLIPFLVVAVGGIWFSVGMLENSIGNSFFRLAEKTGERIDAILDQEVRVIEVVAGSASILRKTQTEANSSYAGKTEAEVLELMKKTDDAWTKAGADEHPVKNCLTNMAAERLRDVQRSQGVGHLEILATDVRGGLVAATGKTADYYQADEEWWQKAYNRGRGAVYASDIHFDRSVEKDVVAVCVPVRDDGGHVVGIVKALLDSQSLFRPIVDLRMGITGHAYLIDKSGKILITSGNTPECCEDAEEARWRDIRDLFHSGKQWLVKDKAHHGMSEIMAAAPLRTEARLAPGSLGGEKWIVLHQGEEEALASPHTMRIILSGAALFLGGIIALVGLWASSRIIAPIKALEGAVEVIGAGNFDYRLEDKRSDELGRLSREINKMAERLGTSYRALEGQVSDYVRNLQKSTKDLVIVADRQGRIETCSPNIEVLLGYRTDELTEIETFVYRVFPGVCETIEELFREEAKPLFPEDSYPFMTKDGATGWARLAFLSSADGERTFLSIRDITAEHTALGQMAEARAELDQIFQVVGHGIRVVDREFNVLRANDAFLRMCGLSRGDALVRKCYEAFPGPLCHTPDCPTSRIMKGEPVIDFEVIKTRKDGTVIPCNVIVTPFRDSKGKIIGAVEVMRDMTNLKEMQSQLLQSEKMASIGQLAAGVAHEINNPIGFINSNLTTLDEYRRELTGLISGYLRMEDLIRSLPAALENEEVTRILETVRGMKDVMDLDFILGDLEKIVSESREGTKRVKEIVQDLKDFSHVDQAELKYANINRGLDSTLNIAWNEIKYKATVTKDYGELPEVYCYPQQVNQVFMNILVNAAQAIEDKGEIRISTRSINGATPMVEIEIRDTGKGMPAENLSRVFDPFFSTKPVGKGTGLGLSIAYKIIEKHQGEIKVESEVGKGTAFTIKLPVDRP
ncbi:MAG: PAS domain-containing protein [Pseudomonadota bacterium]